MSGGAALLATSLVAGSGLFTPALGTLLFGTKLKNLTSKKLLILPLGSGAALVGGNLMAQNMCLGPIYCKTTSGKCCLVVSLRGNFICPISC